MFVDLPSKTCRVATNTMLILVQYYIFVLTQCLTHVDYSTVQVMCLLIADNHWYCRSMT